MIENAKRGKPVISETKMQEATEKKSEKMKLKPSQITKFPRAWSKL